MSNQQIFFTKDKECIVNNIRKFIEQNRGYYKSEEDNISALEREYIVERFNEIINDIIGLDEDEYQCFVFKNTSVDDGVECWFQTYGDNDEYVNKSLKDLEEYTAEFVVIKDDRIDRFVSNLDYKYK